MCSSVFSEPGGQSEKAGTILFLSLSDLCLLTTILTSNEGYFSHTNNSPALLTPTGCPTIQFNSDTGVRQTLQQFQDSAPLD